MRKPEKNKNISGKQREPEDPTYQLGKNPKELKTKKNKI